MGWTANLNAVCIVECRICREWGAQSIHKASIYQVAQSTHSDQSNLPPHLTRPRPLYKSQHKNARMRIHTRYVYVPS